MRKSISSGWYKRSWSKDSFISTGTWTQNPPGRVCLFFQGPGEWEEESSSWQENWEAWKQRNCWKAKHHFSKFRDPIIMYCELVTPWDFSCQSQGSLHFKGWMGDVSLPRRGIKEEGRAGLHSQREVQRSPLLMLSPPPPMWDDGKGLGWCPWGTPQRLVTTLKVSLFPRPLGLI